MAAHLAKLNGSASDARQAQRLRAICRAFFDECRLAEEDIEHGRDDSSAGISGGTPPVAGNDSPAAGGVEARGRLREGVRSRLQKCAGFVAILTLLMQPWEEWQLNKRFVVVSDCGSGQGLDGCTRLGRSVLKPSSGSWVHSYGYSSNEHHLW